MPERDAFMRSTVPYVSIAGDGAGVEGADVARLEGSIAGAAAAAAVQGLTGDELDASTMSASRDLRVARRFSRGLRHAYPISVGGYALAEDDTIVVVARASQPGRSGKRRS